MLLERKLGGDGKLAEFVAERRATKSWTAIAQELSAQTGMRVSDETLRCWFASRVRVVIEPAGIAS